MIELLDRPRLVLASFSKRCEVWLSRRDESGERLRGAVNEEYWELQIHERIAIGPMSGALNIIVLCGDVEEQKN